MSQYTEDNCRAFTAGGAIAAYLRVRLSSGVLAAAGVSEQEIGTIENAAFASGDVRSVRLRNAYGTRKMVAAGAITAGAAVYAAAGGKITATVNPYPVGVALEAAGADNDIIEVMNGPAAVSLRVARGVHTTASAADTVATGLASVVAVVATFQADPQDDPFLVTATVGDQAGSPAAGSVIIRTWRNTGGTDPTPTAATTFSRAVNWIAIGT